VINAGNREKIVSWFEKHRAGLNVQVQDQTFDTTMIAVQGPRAVELVAGMFAADVTQLKYYHAQPTRYRDKGCVVSRTGYTGEDGFEVMLPNVLGGAIWDEFIAKGAVPCGLGARDTLRLEAAMPLYGHELTEEINPIQAGLAWAVKLDKGDFIGRDSLRTASTDRTKPVRAGLKLEGKRAAREGSSVTGANSQLAGMVTSGSYCPWLEQSLAMAYLRPEFASVGTPLDVDTRGSSLHATVVPLPFYKRSKP
jgi:aminomethyltransferase